MTSKSHHAWLSDLFREAMDVADRSVGKSPRRTHYVVGWLLGHTDMGEKEQDEIMRRLGGDDPQ